MRVFLHPARPGIKPEILSLDLEHSAATTADNRVVCRAMLFQAAISSLLTSAYGTVKVWPPVLARPLLMSDWFCRNILYGDRRIDTK
jgi:hypothetical protein